MIHNIDPDILFIVEGLNFATDFTEGGGIKANPIRQEELLVPHKLVYSAHYYDWHNGLARTSTYEEFKQDLDEKISFVASDSFSDPTPMWFGEFGTNKRNREWNYFIRYLKDRPEISWSYWPLNGYKHDVTNDEAFGIYNGDFKTVRHNWKLSDMQDVQTRSTDIKIDKF